MNQSSFSTTVRVPATSANLGPGFDSLGLALQLYNFVTVRARRESDGDARVFSLDDDPQFANLPTGESNIAFRAAQLLLQHIEARVPPFTLLMKNSIPLSRGLGSSSAARAGAMVAVNEWVKYHGAAALSRDEILCLCSDLEGHPDNAAAALLGGLTVSAMRDASTQARQSALALRVEIEEFPSFLVFIPDAELETEHARGALPAEYSRGDAVFNLSRVGLLLAALQQARFEMLREALRDRLHQDYRAPLMRGYREIEKSALQNGALGVTISGAGSTALIWLPPHDASTQKSIKIAVESAAREANVAGQVLALDVDEEGCTIINAAAENATA